METTNLLLSSVASARNSSGLGPRVFAFVPSSDTLGLGGLGPLALAVCWGKPNSQS